MNWIEVIGTVVGSLGGFEAIKWVINRQELKKESQIKVKADDFQLLRESITFLQERLQDKETRFESQTQRLRSVQDELDDVRHDLFETRMELAEKKCEDRDCPFRLPPNVYTPPKSGENRESYFSSQPNTQKPI